MGIIHTTVIVEDYGDPRKFYVPVQRYGVCCTNRPSSRTVRHTIHCTHAVLPPVLQPAPPPQRVMFAPSPPALVTVPQPEAPRKKILGLRYTGTGVVVPIVDGKGNFVPADAKGMIWIPSMKMWLGGPECVFK